MCEVLASTSAPDRTTTFLYALGSTQHTVGAQNIRTMAMIQLLLGNMGMAGGGVNALRGHSNIQGLTDLGLLSTSLPGYLTLPSEKQVDLQSYLEANTPKATLADQVNYWSNYPKFFVSLMKSFYGDAAQKRTTGAMTGWSGPDLRRHQVFQHDGRRQSHRLFLPMVQPGCVLPGQKQSGELPEQAEVHGGYRSAGDETSTFWQNHGESNDVDPASIQRSIPLAFDLLC